MFPYLRDGWKSRDCIFLCAGDNPRMAIDFGAVTDPDIIVVVAFDEREIKDLRPVLNKSESDSGFPIKLYLMDNPRMVPGGACLNLEHLRLFMR